MTATTTSTMPSMQEQASVILAHAAGYASHRTVAIGLRSGLLRALARLVPGGLQQVPGLPERLAAGATVVDSACGTGIGLVRLAAHYPD